MRNSFFPKVEAIVLDLFGVMIAFDKDLVPARLARHCADPVQALRGLDGVMARRDIITGKLSLAHVHRELVEAMGLSLSLTEFEAAWLEPYSWPMPGMAELVVVLAQDHRLVLLSNVDLDYWQVVRAAHPEFDVFDALLISGEIGVAKPDAAAFQRAATAAGTDPSRCLFVDDTKVNVEAAHALGFQTHRFESTARFRKHLRDLQEPLP